MKGIVITPENVISVQNFGDPLYKTVGAAVGGGIEIVHPRLLEQPFCMIVDDEGLLKEYPLNVVGSFLYETLSHGCPIVGTVVFMKEGIRDGEPDIIGLSDEDVQYLTDKFNHFFKLKGETTP